MRPSEYFHHCPRCGTKQTNPPPGNVFTCKEVTYPVLDFFFTARAVAPEHAQALDDVAGFAWLREDEVLADELAFPSMQAAWNIWRKGRQ